MRTYAFSIAVSLSILIGCAPMPTQDGTQRDMQDHQTAASPSRTDLLNNLFNAFGSLLGSPAHELRQRIERGDLDGAHAFYLQNADRLDQDASSQPMLQSLAAQLQQREEPIIRDLVVRLDQTDPGRPESWPALKTLFSRAASLAGKEDADLLLSRPGYRSSALLTLRTRIENIRAELKSHAAYRFQSYDLISRESFFDAYPLDFDTEERDRLLKARSADIAAAIAGTGTKQSMAVLRNYYAHAGDSATRRHFLQAWYRSHAKEKGIKALTYAQKKEAIQILHERAPELGIAISVAVIPAYDSNPPQRKEAWEARNRKLADHLGGELLPAIDITQAESRLDEWRSQYDYVVIADSARSASTVGAVSRHPESARYVARNDMGPNPEKMALQQELNNELQRLAQAEAARRQAEQQAKNSARQSQSSAVALLGVLNASVYINEESSARSSVDGLRDQLAATPDHVSIPVHANYQRQAVTYRAMALSPVALHVIDVQGNRVHSRYLPSVTQSGDLQGHEQVHPNDAEASRISEEAKNALEENLRLQALSTLPEAMPQRETLLAAIDTGAEPLIRMPVLLRSTKDRFRQEIGQRQAQLASAKK